VELSRPATVSQAVQFPVAIGAAPPLARTRNGEPTIMTQPTDTTPTTTETHTETGTDTDAQPAGTESEQEPSPNSEAARWRTKLRETETQRDSLAERLTGYQRRECEPAVAELLDEPGDLWDIGQANVSEFYGADGALDEERLRAAAAALCEMRPKLAKPAGPRHQNFGQFAPPPPPPQIGWESLIGG
jgi:hypothetical protein